MNFDASTPTGFNNQLYLILLAGFVLALGLALLKRHWSNREFREETERQQRLAVLQPEDVLLAHSRRRKLRLLAEAH